MGDLDSIVNQKTTPQEFKNDTNLKPEPLIQKADIMVRMEPIEVAHNVLITHQIRRRPIYYNLNIVPIHVYKIRKIATYISKEDINLR